MQLPHSIDSAGRGNIYCAYGAVTAPTAYGTAAVNGLLLWNGSKYSPVTQKVNAFILGVCWGASVASTVAGAIGLTGALGQVAAPTSTAAITTVHNLRLSANQPTPRCTPYLAGTVTNAGSFFMPLGVVNTGALTVSPGLSNFVQIDGAVELAPDSWCAITGSAVLSTAVMQLGIIWAEIASP